MGFKCGIVGLPNVGKSTLFNALTSSKNAEAANFPFCTIDPNIGIVDVPDPRLDIIHNIGKSAKKINTNITFVDIAGLVKGASKGEGLGNKFLSHIREVDAIVHLIRCFDSDNIQHVNSKIDPLNDLDVIETEILLSDLEILNRQMEKNKKKVLSEKEIQLLELTLNSFNKNDVKSIRDNISEEEYAFLKRLGILSIRPKLIVCNVDEKSVEADNQYTKSVKDKFKAEQIINICADIEDQIAELEDEDKANFMREIGLKKTGLDRLITQGYEVLNLQTFFTSGPKESRAWTIEKGTKAPQAAAVIHSDFEKKFIRAEVVDYNDFVKLNGFDKAKESGKLRIEGKDYVVKDGDVLFFRVNA